MPLCISNTVPPSVLKSECVMSRLQDSASYISQYLLYKYCTSLFAFASHSVRMCHFNPVVFPSDRQATTKQGHRVLQGRSAKNRLCVVLCRWQGWREETGKCNRKVTCCLTTRHFTVWHVVLLPLLHYLHPEQEYVVQERGSVIYFSRTFVIWSNYYNELILKCINELQNCRNCKSS